ncbi:MAG: FAD-dependent oxidoreductase [Armatimonadetes bacterium]|nr:FAD-dependent oxidoreductase [Armatimonadota bacterium]
MKRVDIAVVGAGILGLAHAYMLSKMGLEVVVFEKNPAPSSYSSFSDGIISPSKLAPSPVRNLANRSSVLWREVIAEIDAWINPFGGIALATAELDMVLYHEFAERQTQVHSSAQVLRNEQVFEFAPMVNQQSVIGGLHFTSDFAIDPGGFIADLVEHLRTQMNVEFYFGTLVTGVDDGYVGNDDVMVQASEVIVCAGIEYQPLFTEVFKNAKLGISAVQQIRIEPTGERLDTGAFLRSPLYTYHAPSFVICPSLPKFRNEILDRFKTELEFGIDHFATQLRHGTIVIGSSYRGTNSNTLPRDEEVDRVLLNASRKIIDDTQYEVVDRRISFVSTGPGGPVNVLRVKPKVRLVNITGDLGTTLAFAVAEDVALEILGKSESNLV